MRSAAVRSAYRGLSWNLCLKQATVGLAQGQCPCRAILEFLDVKLKRTHMNLMTVVRFAVAERRPPLSLLPPLLLAAVLLSACATPIEPRIVEVTRQVPVEVTRTVSERVEVNREVPVEVTRVVPKNVVREVPVEVTRVVPREVEVVRDAPVEVVKEVAVEVTREVVVTPTVRAQPTRRPTATPWPTRAPTPVPTATPRPTTANPVPISTADLEMSPPGFPPDFMKELTRLLNSLPPEEAFADLIANSNLIRVWGFDREAGNDIVRPTAGDPSEGEGLFFDPRPEFNAANTLHVIMPGEMYYVGVKRDQRSVILGGKTWNLEDGWNLMTWPTAGR